MKPSKTCDACGREITWRKKWERSWDDVRWCSDRCRARKVSPLDAQLESAVLGLLDQRAQDATICPSEVARQLGGEQWRDLMEPTRAAARRLVASGQVHIVQAGHVVDPSTAKGPIRIRRA